MIAAFNYGLQYFQTLQFDRLKVSKTSIPTIVRADDQLALSLPDEDIILTGNDAIGNIDLNFTGGDPVLGRLVVITFNKPYKKIPYVILSNKTEEFVAIVPTLINENGFTVNLIDIGDDDDNISFTYLCIESS